MNSLIRYILNHGFKDLFLRYLIDLRYLYAFSINLNLGVQYSKIDIN